MCGIAGYIGVSKNPKASFELITNLFIQIESRGIDAAGCWGTEVGEKGSIIYHKEPGKSSAFVTSPFWKSLQKVETNLMIIHARGASTGMGVPRINKNNHPFVSDDKRIGLIHNGVIHESTYLKSHYETKSDCDSEYLLRIYEAGANSYLSTQPDEEKASDRGYINPRLAGIRGIWETIHQGHMAVAIGEMRDNGERSLFLFRNEKRTIWLVDLRQQLGQIFFFSTTEIWDKAAKACKSNVLPTSTKLTQLKEQELWHFTINEEDKIVTNDNYQRFVISPKKPAKNWTEVGEYNKIIKREKHEHKIMSALDENDEPLITASMAPKSNTNSMTHLTNKSSVVKADTGGTSEKKSSRIQMENLFEQKGENDSPNYASGMEVKDIEDVGAKVIQLTNSIVTSVTNIAGEGSLTMAKFQEILDCFENAKNELEGTNILLNS